MGQLVVQIIEEVSLRLLGRKAGDALQHVELAFLEGLRLGEAGVGLLGLVVQDLVLGLEALHLFVEGLLFLLDAAFLPLDFFSALVQLALGFGALAVDLILSFQNGFFFFGFRRLDGVADNPLCFLFCRSNRIFSAFFAVCNPCQECQDPHNRCADNCNENAGD